MNYADIPSLAGTDFETGADGNTKESRFPAPASGGRRLRSTACNARTTPLVPLAPLDSPNRGRRVACGSRAGMI